jgi:hypothetical protein
MKPMILQFLDKFAHYAQLYRKCHNAATLNGHFPHNYHPVAFPGAFFSSAAFLASKSYASYTVSDPPSLTRALLALRRLPRASLALRREKTPASKRATRCIIAFAPFAN